MSSGSDEQRRWLRRPVSLLAHTVRHTYRTDASFFAASLSYYALTALMPTLLIAFIVAATIGEEVIAREAVRAAGDVLTARGQAFVLATLEDVADRTGIALFAAAVAVVSAIQLFRTLDRAFTLVYDSERSSVSAKLRDGAFVVVVGILGMLAVLLAASTMSLYANDEVRALATPAVVFLASLVALFPLFYSLPDPAVTVREVIPGTVFAAAAWTVVGATLGLYAAHNEGAALYGILGGLLLVVTWLYAAHLSVILGAALNAIVAGHVDPTPRNADPAPGEDADPAPAEDDTDPTPKAETGTVNVDTGTADAETGTADAD